MKRIFKHCYQFYSILGSCNVLQQGGNKSLIYEKTVFVIFWKKKIHKK